MLRKSLFISRIVCFIAMVVITVHLKTNALSKWHYSRVHFLSNKKKLPIYKNLLLGLKPKRVRLNKLKVVSKPLIVWRKLRRYFLKRILLLNLKSLIIFPILCWFYRMWNLDIWALLSQVKILLLFRMLINQFLQVKGLVF